VPVTEDRERLLRFLKQVTRLLSFLVNERIPDGVRERYAALFSNDIVPRLDFVIHEVDAIESEQDQRWRFLAPFGLVGESLKFKVDEFFSWLTIGKVRNILKSANSILGSLSRVFAALDPVKEFKDHLELRLDDDYMNSQDEEITRL
jgi:hypothetical protein